MNETRILLADDEEALRELLREQLSAQGYAIDEEENEKGIRCIASPIYNEVGKAVAAISISVPAFRITKKVIQETFFVAAVICFLALIPVFLLKYLPT